MAEIAPGIKLRRARLAQRPTPSQRQAGELVGVNKTTWGAWESGRNRPQLRVVRQLSHLWGFPEPWIWDGEDTQVPELNLNPIAPSGTVCVPYWGEVPGRGWEVPLDPKPATISGAVDPEGAVAVRIAGDALAPHFHHGQIVVGRRTSEPVEGLVHLCRGPGGRLDLRVARGGQMEPLQGAPVPGEHWDVLARIVHVEFTDPQGIRA